MVDFEKEHGMPRFGRLMIFLLVWVITVTCARITVNIYFPAAEIKDAATQIEHEVRQKDATPAEPSTPSHPPQGSRLWPGSWRVRVVLGVPEAAAQKIDINISTPAIRQLIARRKQRYASLVPLFNQGALGENNRGLLDLRSLDALSLPDKARARTLLQQENSDRQQLYQALATANNISPDKVSDIATIFAEVNRREARAGWWIQEPNGNWRKK
jgi:uncharacterized protein YdbL (DUF1318 family)